MSVTNRNIDTVVEEVESSNEGFARSFGDVGGQALEKSFFGADLLHFEFADQG